MTQKIMKRNRLFAILLVTVMAIVALAGCGGGPSEAPMPAAAPAAPAAGTVPQVATESWGFAYGASDGDFSVAERSLMAADADTNWALAEAPVQTSFTDRMVIRNASMSLDTTRFSYTFSAVERTVALYGGFIENSSTWLSTNHMGEEFWRADFVLRVPVDYFDTVNNDIMALGEVVNFSTTSEDVTMQFQDLESRLRIREEEERRIEAMLENTANLEELIRLESRLANLRLVMERYTRRMIEIDQLASFATINLSLREVSEEDIVALYTDITFIDRIAGAFDTSINITLGLLEGFAVLIASIVLPITILSLPVLGAVMFVKKVLIRNAPK